jgi:L-aminoadipate-semialdehyde dehydrogenase
MFDSLPDLGYEITPMEYVHWRSALMELTLSSGDHALYPLLHFVLDDLPTSTKSAELDDTNTRNACERELETNGLNGLVLKCPNINGLMGLYLGYMIKVGFLEAPKISDKLVRLECWNGLSDILTSRTGK